MDEDRENIQPSPESVKHFYELVSSLDQFSVSIKPPTIEIPLLKRLGEPAFAEEPGLRYLLLPAYRLVSMEAIQAAYSDTVSPSADESSESDNNQNTQVDS